jgi:hypothetical protein
MPIRRSVVRHTHVGSPSRLNSFMEARALLEIALLPASLPRRVEMDTPFFYCPDFWLGSRP